MGKPLSRRALETLAPLDRGFYQRPTRTVARELLGKLLIRRLPEGLVAVRLVEVEAYLGVGDPAAHTFGGRRTARNEVMWGEGGHSYVYFTYGMHHCCNVVTLRTGRPEAVLLRGALPVLGEPLIVARRSSRAGRRLLDGPARLCQGLGIDREVNGADLTSGDAIWLASDGVSCREAWVRRLPRVGVAYAGEAARWPLRFLVDLNARVSPRRRGAAGGAGGAATRARG
ncbi:MAG TPA: DNA-3-methyladenine glycosylase [Thermoanaerobaculaceae bacterium]|nr:DNA-3-methyladenine glycosylase [Thermoanaerobaculaceae bacterium]